MPIFQSVSSQLSRDFSAEHLASLKSFNMPSFSVHVVLAMVLQLMAAVQNTPLWRTILTWCIVLIVVGTLRLLLNRIEVRRSYQDPDATKHWVTKYILFSSVMSLLWGGVALYLSTINSNQIVIYVLLIAVIMTSIPLLVASKEAFYTQLFLILAPITIRLFFDPNSFFVGLAFLGLVIAAVFAANYLNHVVLQLQKTQLELQVQADTDQLTQLSNRRAFDSGFKREWQRSLRKSKPIALLVVDIDEFKLYNDTYGHLAGDDTLKKIAMIIRKTARRSSDIAARIGGEEFAVLLPDTDLEGARCVAQRLQQNISRLDINHPIDTDKKLTVSIGISCCKPTQSQDGESLLFPAMLVKSADYAMYHAKAAGKNCIREEGCGMHSVHDSLK
ncbi:MAG: GGDEF domain-containing protein [Thiotrichaceae bacterium]|nr:GGDEF domain-containing protein [Thiotrichaceae bacterium]